MYSIKDFIAHKTVVNVVSLEDTEKFLKEVLKEDSTIKWRTGEDLLERDSLNEFKGYSDYGTRTCYECIGKDIVYQTLDRFKKLDIPIIKSTDINELALRKDTVKQNNIYERNIVMEKEQYLRELKLDTKPERINYTARSVIVPDSIVNIRYGDAIKDTKRNIGVRLENNDTGFVLLDAAENDELINEIVAFLNRNDYQTLFVKQGKDVLFAIIDADERDEVIVKDLVEKKFAENIKGNYSFIPPGIANDINESDELSFNSESITVTDRLNFLFSTDTINVVEEVRDVKSAEDLVDYCISNNCMETRIGCIKKVYLEELIKYSNNKGTQLVYYMDGDSVILKFLKEEDIIATVTKCNKSEPFSGSCINESEEMSFSELELRSIVDIVKTKLPSSMVNCSASELMSFIEKTL